MAETEQERINRLNRAIAQKQLARSGQDVRAQEAGSEAGRRQEAAETEQERINRLNRAIAQKQLGQSGQIAQKQLTRSGQDAGQDAGQDVRVQEAGSEAGRRQEAAERERGAAERFAGRQALVRQQAGLARERLAGEKKTALERAKEGIERQAAISGLGAGAQTAALQKRAAQELEPGFRQAELELGAREAGQLLELGEAEEQRILARQESQLNRDQQADQFTRQLNQNAQQFFAQFKVGLEELNLNAQTQLFNQAIAMKQAGLTPAKTLEFANDITSFISQDGRTFRPLRGLTPRFTPEQFGFG